MTKEQVIQFWKDNKIKTSYCEFSCGGDSMSDITIYLENENGEQVINTNIEFFLLEEIYDNVTFYQNSDGHYLGEYGTVDITLEENEFHYIKNAISEYSEIYTENILVLLDDKEISFITNYVENIVGDKFEVLFNYKKDFIKTEKIEEIINSISNKIIENINNFNMKNIPGELTDAQRFESLRVISNNLELKHEIGYYQTVPSEN